MFLFILWSLEWLQSVSFRKSCESTTAFEDLVKNMSKHENDVDPYQNKNNMHDDTCPVVELPVCDPRSDEYVMEDCQDKTSKIIDY